MASCGAPYSWLCLLLLWRLVVLKALAALLVEEGYVQALVLLVAVLCSVQVQSSRQVCTSCIVALQEPSPILKWHGGMLLTHISTHMPFQLSGLVAAGAWVVYARVCI